MGRIVSDERFTLLKQQKKAPAGANEKGVLDRGITCVETFDYDVVDKIYDPYDNLGPNVILHGDGTREYKVLGALAEAVKAQSSDPVQWNRPAWCGTWIRSFCPYAEHQ